MGPGYAKFESATQSFQSKVTTVMVTIAKKIAETLFKHDPATLLHAMTKQQSFKDFVLPDVDDSEAGYPVS